MQSLSFQELSAPRELSKDFSAENCVRDCETSSVDGVESHMSSALYGGSRAQPMCHTADCTRISSC